MRGMRIINASSFMFYFAILGLSLSIYAGYVHLRKKKNNNYNALCDISKNVSCSTAFASDYGKFLAIRNYFWGIIFYSSIILFNILGYVFGMKVLSVIGMLAIIPLAYISYFKMKNFCILCTLIYVLNILIFIEVYQGLL